MKLAIKNKKKTILLTAFVSAILLGQAGVINSGRVSAAAPACYWDVPLLEPNAEGDTMTYNYMLPSCPDPSFGQFYNEAGTYENDRCYRIESLPSGGYSALSIYEGRAGGCAKYIEDVLNNAVWLNSSDKEIEDAIAAHPVPIFGTSIPGSGPTLSTPGDEAVTIPAECTGEDSNGNRVGVNNENCKILDYLVDFINLLSGLVGVVIVIMVAVGGIQYSTARDNPQAIAAAKGRIINALLALVFYLIGFAFLQWLVPGGVF